MAAQQLNGTKTAARISGLLGTLTLEDIATCPDEVRDLEEYHAKMSAVCSQIFPDPPKGTASWHFADLPIKGATYEPSKADIQAVCKNNCALTQIPASLAVLKAAKLGDSAAQKLQEQQALAYVVHFIGDIHQPLHAANRDDSGGNAEHVSFFGTDASGDLKLHTIWDKQIVSKIDSDETKLATDLAAQVTAAKKEKATTDPTKWALQSYNYARDVAYNGIPPANGKTDVATLGQPYQDTAAPVVRMQIARASVRLAAALKKNLH